MPSICSADKSFWWEHAAEELRAELELTFDVIKARDGTRSAASLVDTGLMIPARWKTAALSVCHRQGPCVQMEERGIWTIWELNLKLSISKWKCCFKNVASSSLIPLGSHSWAMNLHQCAAPASGLTLLPLAVCHMTHSFRGQRMLSSEPCPPYCMISRASGHSLTHRC